MIQRNVIKTIKQSLIACSRAALHGETLAIFHSPKAILDLSFVILASSEKERGEGGGEGTLHITDILSLSSIQSSVADRFGPRDGG